MKKSYNSKNSLNSLKDNKNEYTETHCCFGVGHRFENQSVFSDHRKGYTLFSSVVRLKIT